mgnify:CR=1 FL=1
MTTFANIKKESTGQLLDYFFDRVTFKLENQYDTTIFIEEALHRLVEVYYLLGLKDESLKYAKLKSWTVPDSLVSMVPAGSLCNLITRFASVRPSIASSNDSHDGA